MPLHDLTRVEDGVFHDFHFEMIHAVKKALNAGLLPSAYYASAEQIAAGLGPSVTAELERTRIRTRRGHRIVVRHVSGHRSVAVVEVVSRSNKASAEGLLAFVEKADEFLRNHVHLLVIDLFPPGPRDRRGIHGAIWYRLFRRRTPVLEENTRALVSYESDERIRAYVRNLSVGDLLPEVPLFLEPDRCVQVPMEAAYQEAWGLFPVASREPLLAT